jgi:hypothetical protein
MSEHLLRMDTPTEQMIFQALRIATASISVTLFEVDLVGQRLSSCDLTPKVGHLVDSKLGLLTRGSDHSLIETASLIHAAICQRFRDDMLAGQVACLHLRVANGIPSNWEALPTACRSSRLSACV